jgi:hypothetical protein
MKNSNNQERYKDTRMQTNSKLKIPISKRFVSFNLIIVSCLCPCILYPF